MTALQRISASIKRRRSSVIGNSLSAELEDQHVAERRSLLNEAKAFIGQAQAGGGGGGERLGIEELKLLLFLTDMLECSLLNLPPSAAEKQQQQQQSQRRKLSSTEKPNNSNTNNNDTINNNSNSCCYTTWAAGGTQGQQHRRQRKMMMFNKLQQQQQKPQEHQQQMSVGNMPSLSMMELGLGMGTIHEEEHEQHHPPQICIGTEVKSGTTMEIAGKAALEGEGELEDTFSLPSAEPGELIVYEEAEPLFVTLIPHICLVLAAIAYMLLGSLAYRWFDPEIGAKPSARAFIWAFQLLATIGWGDSHASTVFSQAFTVVYICFGIPMLFSAYANFGRLLTEFCCLQGPLLWHKLFGSSNKDSEDLPNPIGGDVVQRLPLIIISNLLILHQCVGLVIYSFWLKDWPIISTVYFSITTMATSGFGDFHPDTDSWFETIIAVLYISVGIVLLSALFLTIALYYQAIHYIHLKENCVGPIYGHMLRLIKGGEHNKKGQTGNGP